MIGKDNIDKHNSTKKPIPLALALMNLGAFGTAMKQSELTAGVDMRMDGLHAFASKT